jgi:hypothetical protein
MTTWNSAVTYRHERQADPSAVFEALEALEAYGAVASVSRNNDGGTIQLTYDHDGTLVQAVETAAELVRGAIPEGINGVEIVAVSTQTEEAFEAGLAEPVLPEMVGYAEIAELAGVTRQRAHQLAHADDFPPPAISTKQGPLMRKAAVTEWLAKRDRRPGRRKVNA